MNKDIKVREESLELREERLELRDESLDELLDKLQSQQPMVEDEDAFIDSIMDSLPDVEVRGESLELSGESLELSDESLEAREERTSPIILMIRSFSSIAAMLLVGLFIFLNVDNPAKAQQMANDNNQIISKSSYYSDMSKCTTPEEAMKLYADKKQRSINNLISMYNEK